MKSNTFAALVLAAGFLTTAAFADDPPASPVFSPTPLTPLSLAPIQISFISPPPALSKPASFAPKPAFTVNWDLPSPRDLSGANHFASWRPKTVADQMLLDADASPSELAAAMAVSARPPPTINSYDPFATAYRDPPVFFRVTFNFGRSHRS
jgi:hypothetical protein